MDIQSYILDRWQAKMSAERPVLTIYDSNGFYREILPLAEEKGIKVIDTSKGLLHARLSASRFWCNELALDKDAKMIIYRNREMPTNKRSWVEEPFAAFVKSGMIFPVGPQDEYKNICYTFLPAKKKELDSLFESDSISFNMVNALLDGAAYPELENFTGGKSFAEITIGLLAQTDCNDMKWQKEWQNFCSVQYPGLEAKGASLKDIQLKLWSYILFSEFVFDLPERLPDSLRTVAMAPKEMQEKIYLVCDSIRKRIDLRDNYVRAANKIAEQLKLAELFAKSKHLGDRVTFGFENSVEFDRYLEYLKDGNLSEAKTMYDKNANDVWAQEDASIATFWKLGKYALDLLLCINRGLKSDGNLVELVDWYSDSGCEADYAFRRYHTEKMNADNLPLQIKSLTELLNKRYKDFTERGVEVYQKNIKQCIKIPKLRNQGCLQKVYPALNDGKRVVLFMIDAFRYEMGKAFAQSIGKSYQERVEVTPRISYLPSITRFGMANHLDDISISLSDGILQPIIGNEIVSTPEDRIAYLRNRTNLEIQDFNLESFDSTAVNDSTRLLVIRSTGIDAAGENSKFNGLPSMESELKKLAKLINECKNLSFDLAVLVADHGFMVQPVFKVGDQIEKPVGSDLVLVESRMMAGSLNESPETISFAPAELGADIDVMKLSYAENYTVFKKGEVYYHEGLSLQENVVPIITIKLQEDKKRQSFSVKLRYKKGDTGTIYSRRAMIDIQTAFENLFSDGVNIKLVVKDDNGVEIGQPVGHFYDEVSQLLHIPSGVAEGRQAISIDDDYHGSNIVITALDAETNATLSVLKLMFEGND